MFLLRRNQGVDLHNQELKNAPEWIFKMQVFSFFLPNFFLLVFFHIFFITNQLPGFSTSKLATVEEFSNVYIISFKKDLNVSINEYFLLPHSVTDFRDHNSYSRNASCVSK